MKKILIGGAWPYANGSLHIGHIAGLLPGDILARYHRAIGDDVYFVSGSDCHGTPVAIRAKQENRTPQEISDFYHKEFVECFEKLGFTYDLYTKTSSDAHKNFVKEFHGKLYESPYVYEKEVPQAYCNNCNTFLADRFVLGKCPKCGSDTRGDQCDACGTVLEPEALIEPICAVCGKPVSFKNSKHLYIAISKLQTELKALVNRHPEWRKDAKHYYVHEKDNIPFHTIILSSLLLGNGEGWHLPDQIVSSEYLTLEGRKISTSQNYAIWVKELLEHYEADSIRYFFIANGPEKKDADFSWREYVHSHNSELLGAYGNFVNRSLAFIVKYCDGVVPNGIENPELDAQIDEIFLSVGKQIEKGCFKDALAEIFNFVRSANKFFDTERPWITRNTDKAACDNTLYQCVQIIANLAVLLSPFLSFSSEKVLGWLNVNNKWERKVISAGYVLPEIEILFQRIDKKVIEIETEKLESIL